MAVKRKAENQERAMLLEVPPNSDLPLRLEKISEQSGLSPLNLFQKWILQEEFTIGLARSSQAPKEKINAPIAETRKKDVPKPKQLPEVKKQKEATAPAKPQPQSQEYRAELLKRAAKLKKEGVPLKKIAETFNEEKVPTLSGTGKWYGSSITVLLGSK